MDTKSESLVNGGYSDTACWMSLSHQIGETRREISETGGEILSKIGEGNCDLQASIGKVGCDVLTKLGDSESRIRESVHKIGCDITKNDNDNAQRATIHLNGVHASVIKEIGDKNEITRTQLDGISRELCDLKMEGFKNTQLVLTALSNNKLDEKNELIQKLLHKDSRNHYSHQFALQNQSIDYLKQMINSLEYNQRATSVIKQNGVGNAAIPVMPVTQQ